MSNLAATDRPSQRSNGGTPYRVMLVDDSAVIRGFFKRWLEVDTAVKIIASVSDGAQAVRAVGKLDVEVVVLDIEMPGMDGMTALPKLLQIKPNIKVIMASTLTTRNAKVSIAALSQGAADYIPKPTSTRELHSTEDFRIDLVRKVKALGWAIRRSSGQTIPISAARENAGQKGATQVIIKSGDSDRSDRVIIDRSRPITLRAASTKQPEILAIGSSTGGPQALFTIFGELKNDLDVPVIITQHMPATFTAILAEHIRRVSGADASEAIDGECVKSGRVYIAPGNWHMKFARDKGNVVIRLSQDPPENFCRPAVDAMLRSVADIYGDRALGVILTGMGHDGYSGGDLLTKAGGTIIAQDEESSVIWGMPGAVASGGLCSAVLPLGEMGSAIKKLLSGSRL